MCECVLVAISLLVRYYRQTICDGTSYFLTVNENPITRFFAWYVLCKYSQRHISIVKINRILKVSSYILLKLCTFLSICDVPMALLRQIVPYDVAPYS